MSASGRDFAGGMNAGDRRFDLSRILAITDSQSFGPYGGTWALVQAVCCPNSRLGKEFAALSGTAGPLKNQLRMLFYSFLLDETRSWKYKLMHRELSQVIAEDSSNVAAPVYLAISGIIEVDYNNPDCIQAIQGAEQIALACDSMRQMLPIMADLQSWSTSKSYTIFGHLLFAAGKYGEAARAYHTALEGTAQHALDYAGAMLFARRFFLKALQQCQADQFVLATGNFSLACELGDLQSPVVGQHIQLFATMHYGLMSRSKFTNRVRPVDGVTAFLSVEVLEGLFGEAEKLAESLAYYRQRVLDIFTINDADNEEEVSVKFQGWIRVHFSYSVLKWLFADQMEPVNRNLERMLQRYPAHVVRHLDQMIDTRSRKFSLSAEFYVYAAIARRVCGTPDGGYVLYANSMEIKGSPRLPNFAARLQDPVLRQHYFALCSQYFLQHLPTSLEECQEALEAHQQMIAVEGGVNSDSAARYSLIADCYASGYLDEPIKAYEAMGEAIARERDPDMLAVYHVKRSRLCTILGETQAAEADLVEVRRLAPDGSSLASLDELAQFYDEGRRYFLANRFAEARTELVRLLTINPGYKRAKNTLLIIDILQHRVGSPCDEALLLRLISDQAIDSKFEFLNLLERFALDAPERAAFLKDIKDRIVDIIKPNGGGLHLSMLQTMAMMQALHDENSLLYFIMHVPSSVNKWVPGYFTAVKSSSDRMKKLQEAVDKQVHIDSPHPEMMRAVCTAFYEGVKKPVPDAYSVDKIKEEGFAETGKNISIFKTALVNAEDPGIYHTIYMLLLRDYFKHGRIHEALDVLVEDLNSDCSHASTNISIYIGLSQLAPFFDAQRVLQIFNSKPGRFATAVQALREQNTAASRLACGRLLMAVGETEEAVKEFEWIVNNQTKCDNEDMFASLELGDRLTIEEVREIRCKMEARIVCPHPHDSSIFLSPNFYKLFLETVVDLNAMSLNGYYYYRGAPRLLQLKNTLCNLATPHPYDNEKTLLLKQRLADQIINGGPSCASVAVRIARNAMPVVGKTDRMKLLSARWVEFLKNAQLPDALRATLQQRMGISSPDTGAAAAAAAAAAPPTPVSTGGWGLWGKILGKGAATGQPSTGEAMADRFTAF